MNILIQDFKFADKSDISEYYHLFCCDSMQLADVLDENTAFICRVIGGGGGGTPGPLLDPATAGKV
jgi:hypothetical protein